MPDYDSRQSDPYPYPTAAEVDQAPGDYFDKAARNIVASKIEGIPRRAFLLGNNDKSVVMKGVREFIVAVDEIISAIAPADLSGSLKEAVAKVEGMMLDHKCGDQAAPPKHE